MTDQEYHEKIMEYAHSLGYPYAFPVGDGEFAKYYMCFNEFLYSFVKKYGVDALYRAKLGSTPIIYIDLNYSIPKIVNRDEDIILNKRFIESSTIFLPSLRD